MRSSEQRHGEPYLQQRIAVSVFRRTHDELSTRISLSRSVLLERRLVKRAVSCICSRIKRVWSRLDAPGSAAGARAEEEVGGLKKAAQ